MDHSLRRVRSAFRRLMLVAAFGLCVAVCANPALALPTLDELMTDFGFSKADVQKVRNGELVTGTAKETSEKELAVAMVFLVKAPARTLVSNIEAGKGFRSDPQVQAVTEIKGEATIDDLKAIVLQPEGEKEAERYLEAEAGDTLNLSAPEIAAFQALGAGAGKTQVETELRRMLLARYQAYRTKGLGGIAPYARGDAQTQPAESLRRATEASRGLKQHVPALYNALLNYPQGLPADLKQSFFCIRYTMSDRPTFTLRQRLSLPIDDGYVVADREFYVSHDYNEMQAIGALLPVEAGTAVVYLNRTTTDQLGGFGASTKQAIGRRMMASQISEIFEKSRAAFK